ncbi:sensor histidine kinase [Nocardioides cynanchi]|uniref:sensor histidine kinase n=1 Tax=Nocardioides cynanchi TaxID=2558918 RepID=UPI001243FB8A|nr:HAMP domain-containing sensor histidine kinase [Nocardioides cynanchi]
MNSATVRETLGSSSWEERRWHYRRSLASRVVLLTTIAVGLAVAFVALGAFLTVRMSLQSSLDNSLLERAQKAAGGTTMASITNEQVPLWAVGAADVRIFYIDSHGNHTTDTGPKFQIGTPELAVASTQGAPSIRTISAGRIDYRVVTVPAGGDTALVLAQNLAPQERVLRKMGAVMLLFGLAGVIGAAAAGWAVARNGLRPVRRLTDNVEVIARTEELTPLPVEGGDEVARLATAFNAMLAALSASRDRQRRLVADAGHELRTPLTSLRTNLDLLLQADESGGLDPQLRAELLDDVGAQIEEMSTLVGDLVELARDEPIRPVVEQVDLADVVDRAVARARRRGTSLVFEVDTEPWWVTGEARSLERAVTNLLDNAVKWSPRGGTVSVRLNHGQLTVDDQGPGIAEEDRSQVFDRFYRSEESRSMPGSGLGLSIVRQVAERHSGAVRADEAPAGGTRMVLQLPGHALVAG